MNSLSLAVQCLLDSIVFLWQLKSCLILVFVFIESWLEAEQVGEKQASLEEALVRFEEQLYYQN